MSGQTERVTAASGYESNTPVRVSPEKIAIPEAPAGAVQRARLLDSFNPGRCRLTLFVGPGGFGKTTLLADCCRWAEARGDKVLWLSLDEWDDAERLVAHLIYAADLDLDYDASGGGPQQDVAIRYLESLMREVHADGRRWVLALDELERIPASGAVVVDYLISRCPANLHLALAGRAVPHSIEVATPIAQGRAVAVGVENLRFTLAEFGLYFQGAVSRERLAELWAESRGWPIAACLQRNRVEDGMAEVTDLSLNWVAARLMRGVDERDRRFVLEAGCFEWVDAEMFEEVLGVGSMERLRRLPMLRGLVQGIAGGTAFRLHPLVRRHAESELRALGDDRNLRRRIARALADRGRTVEAMRQALEADDATLAAEIFERAGAVRLVLTVGSRDLEEAVALLPQDVTNRFPRLELARLASLVSKQGGVLPDTTPVPPDGAELSELPANAWDLYLDQIILSGHHVLSGCGILDSPEAQSVLGQAQRVLSRDGLDPVVVGGISHGLAIYRYESADLDAALATVRRVQDVRQSCPTAALEARFLEGAILFAQGVVSEAETVLVQARHAARRNFAGRVGFERIGAALLGEAALEANRVTAAAREVPSVSELVQVGPWLSVYAAALDVRIELELREDAPGRVRHTLEEALAFAQANGLPTLERWLSGVRVAVLARTGSLDEANLLAARVLREGTGLDVAEERRHGWRVMEAITGARVQLLLARGEWVAALALGQAFVAWARDRGLARSRSRATALAMHAAWRAGDAAAAEEFLIENLRLLERTGFSRALIERGEAAVAVLEGFDPEDPGLIGAAEAARAAISAPGGTGDEVTFGAPAMEVLARLDVGDKEIARALGLTQSGVRYHVKKIIRELGVTNRREALRRARELGMVPPAAHH